MDTQLIHTTRRGDLHALGLGGQPVILAYEQIMRYLRHALSPAHAYMLAEPSLDATRGTVDWYGPTGGAVLRLSAVDPTARAAVEEKLARRVGEIKSHAEALRGTGNESDRRRADMLLLALEIPGLDYVWVAGDEPLLVGWGHILEGPGAPRGVLMRLTPAPALRSPATTSSTSARAEGPASPPVPSVRRSLAWLWWLGGLLLAVLLILTLLWWQWPWVVAELGIPNPSCRLPTATLAALDELNGERARGDALQTRLANIKREIAARQAQCPSGGPRGQLPNGPSRASAAAPPLSDTSPSPGKSGNGQPPSGQDPSNPPDDQARVRAAGGKMGQVQLTLSWDDENDLDLGVICPDGNRISFKNDQRAACGGQLDVDANASNANAAVTRTPVEHVVWQLAPAPGTYKILVSYFLRRAGASTPYRLTIHVDGKPDKQLQGVIKEGQPDMVVHELTLP